jgi:hypothetical protein
MHQRISRIRRHIALDYQESLDFLKQLNKFGMNFGLRRIERLLDLSPAPPGT